ncbi:unnamed protein product [Adineta ricciae]|uniref:VWFA domain-containing protein n=1 Tax=Adineta ricciae TaxID=249248 RepID=A0A815M467_ADIRI|nr:unnamed protein product [Adineta ricciae]
MKVMTELDEFDVDALDAEIQNISNQLKDNVNKLRHNPKNDELQQSIRDAKERLAQLNIWTSKLNTEEARRLLLQQKIKEEQEKIEQRKYEIDQVFKTVKVRSEVDICFLMDCTRSMKSHIDKAKEDIHLLTKMIPNLFKVQPCLAFVGYRDVNSSSPQCLKMDFTKNVDVFEQFLGNVQAVGGSDNDFCEDVFGGLEVIPTLLWTSANRILIHICDAPCHGRQYYDAKFQQRQGTKWDAFPDGDPKNRDITKLLLNIKSLDIQYLSIQLNPRKTRKMFDEFRLIYGSISELDVENPSEMMNVVTKMANSIIMSSIENTMSIFRTTDERKVYTLSNHMPEW